MLCEKHSLFICSAAPCFGSPILCCEGLSMPSSKAAWKTLISLTPSCIYISGGGSRAGLMSVFCLSYALWELENCCFYSHSNVRASQLSIRAFTLPVEKNLWQLTANIFLNLKNSFIIIIMLILIRKNTSRHISNSYCRIDR